MIRRRASVGLWMAFALLVYSLPFVSASLLPDSNTATVIVDGNPITFRGWNLNYRGPGRFITQAENWSHYEGIVSRFNDSLLFSIAAEGGDYAVFSGLNETHFSQLVFHHFSSYQKITDLDIYSNTSLRESLKTALSSLTNMTRSDEIDLKRYDENNLCIPFLWSSLLVGGDLQFGSRHFPLMGHENSSELLMELHWEFLLRINVTQVSTAHPTETRHVTVPCTVAIAQTGVIIGVQYLLPPFSGIPDTTTTNEEEANPVVLLTVGLGVAEEIVEWDGVRMKLVISGNAVEKAEIISVDYKQELIVFDDGGHKISQEVIYRHTQISKFGKYSEDLSNREPVRDTVLSSDWGTFTTYYWHSFLFVSYPGSTKQDVWYDHPDNYYTYHSEEWNVDWYKKISRYSILHASTTTVHETESSATLWSWMLTTATMLIGAYGLLVAAVPLAIAILGATLAFLAVYQGLIWLWVQLVWKTEQGDAWSYSYWGTDGWIQISHGKWRDIWFYAYDTAGSV